MKDFATDHRAAVPVDAATPSTSNPRAASVRLEARGMSKAKGTRVHDFRLGNKIPHYVDLSRIHLNRTLIPLRPLFQIRDENARLRERSGRDTVRVVRHSVVSTKPATGGRARAEILDELMPHWAE